MPWRIPFRTPPVDKIKKGKMGKKKNPLREKFQQEPFEVITVIINIGMFGVLLYFLLALIEVLDK